MPPGTLEARVRGANRRAYIEAAERSNGGVTTDGDLVLVTGTHPSPMIANVVFRDPDVSPIPADPSTLSRVHDLYTAIGHRFSLLTSEGHDADLEAAAAASGWRAVIDLPSMVTHRPLSLPPHVEIRPTSWLEPITGLARFRDVVEAGFADDDDERGMVRAIFALPESIAPSVVAAIAELDGTDASAGLAYHAGDVAVVGWIATIPSFRGRGLGSSVTAALTNRAFTDGVDLVCLEASPMGAPVYEHLGFRRVGLERIWLPPELQSP